MSRWACAADLNNYFRIKDLLGGLTEMQKKILRENIGISMSEGGQSTPTSLTHAELTTLIANSSLTTGARYVITDFQTIYESNLNTKETWGTSTSLYPSVTYSIIVTAIDINKLDPRVIISNHKDWVVEYDPAIQVLADGTKTKGKITYLKDSNNNQAYYDFKNIKFSRTYKEQSTEVTKVFYTFSYFNNGEVADASETNQAHNNAFAEDCYNNVFVGETYYNSFEADCYNNSFYSGCHDCSFKWETVNNIFYESVVDLTGTIAGKIIPAGQNIFSSTVTKYIHNVNENTVMVHFDPDTYAQQITLIPDVYSQQIVTGTIWNSQT